MTMSYDNEASTPTLWHYPDFIRVWSLQSASSVVQAMVDFALPLYLLAVTGSPAVAALIMGAEKLPYVLLGLQVGAMADRWDRRAMLSRANAVRAGVLIVSAVLLATGHTNVWTLALLILLSGCCFVVFDVADNAAFPSLVPVSRLAQASSWMEGSVAVGQLLGPALAGLLLGATVSPGVGLGATYGVAATVLGLGAITLAGLKTNLKPFGTHGPQSVGEAIRQGVRFLLADRQLRLLVSQNFINCFLLAALILSFITAAKVLFGAGTSLTGLALAAGAVAGVIGSLITVRLEQRFGAVRLMGLVGMLWALGQFGLAAASSLVGLIASFGLIALGRPVYFSVLYAYRNTIIPNGIRGRVNSAYRLVSLAAEPAGLAAGGASLQLFGSRPTALIASVLFLTNLLTAWLTQVP